MNICKYTFYIHTLSFAVQPFIVKVSEIVILFCFRVDFDHKPVHSSVAFQSKFPTPKRLAVGFPISPGAPPKHMLTVSWLLNEQPLDSKEILSLGLLDSLMLGTSSSEVSI